jgi:hypothetical protein
MFKSILAFMLLVFAGCFCLPAVSAQTEARQDAGENQFNTSNERIGGLRLGMPEKDLQGVVTCKPQKAREIYEGATGEHVQTWKYPECGVVLKMSSEHKGGPKTVASITITSPCKFATGGGIQIGSTESEVAKAYGQYRDPEPNLPDKKTFVAGSIYDGMIFSFRDGKVVKIFLGAAAE